MNKRLCCLLIFALLLFSVVQQAISADLRQMRKFRDFGFGMFLAIHNLYPARFILRVKTEIGLTAEQQKCIEDMMLTHEESAIHREADLQVRELQFATFLRNEKVDRREMARLVRELGNLSTEQTVEKLNYLLDLRALLTAEQLQKLEAMRKTTLGKIERKR